MDISGIIYLFMDSYIIYSINKTICDLGRLTTKGPVVIYNSIDK